MKTSKIIFVITLLCIGASSCHKKGEVAVPGEAVDVALDSLQHSTPAEPSQAVSFPASFGEWKSLEVPVNIRLSAPKSFSFSGRATFVKGLEIYISLRFLGIEVGQLYATEDSIFVVDKFHKYCISESFKKLAASTGLTLSDLQGYLLGRPERGIPTGLGGVEVLYDWNPATKELGAVGFMRGGVPFAGLEYGAQAETPTGPTASSVSIAAASGKSEIAGMLDYNLSRAKWNSVDEGINFRRPGADYKRISLTKLAENL